MTEKELKNLAEKTVEFKNSLPAILEFQRLNASVMREKYKALIKEGFTEHQALFLCKD